MAMRLDHGADDLTEVHDINVTPFIDVMLVLLIIFMVITPMLQKDVSVDLAQVNNPTQMKDADKEDALVVAITRQGDVYFGKDLVRDTSQLTNKIKDRMARPGSDHTVYLRADARAKYKSVVDVVDNVRAAGVDDLGLLTDQKKQKPGAPPSAGGTE
jgi:biopolymer transport protein ExbD/biopolymer transport protein TolR